MSRHYPARLRTLVAVALVAVALFAAASGAGHRPALAQTAAEEEPTPSPTPAPTPENEELRRLRERNAVLEEQKKIAVNEKDIAAAEKAKLDTQFPKPSTTPLAGTTEVDAGVKIESQMAAYASVAAAADKIADELKGVTIKHLAVYNARDLKSLLGYTVTDSQLNLMTEEYNNQFAPTPKPGPATPTPTPGTTTPTESGSSAKFVLPGATTIASSILGSFVDLIALFRTDTTVKGLSFDVAESALVSETFRALKKNRADVGLYYPAVFPPNLSAERPFVILGKIQNIHQLKTRAEKLTARVAETEKTLGETVAEIATLKKTVQQANADLPVLDKELERLQKVYFKWPSPRLAERIEELHGRIEKVKDDRAKATNALPAKNALKGSLEQKLEATYAELKPLASDIVKADAVTAAIERAESKLAAAERVLGRKFGEADVIALERGFSDAVKKQLVEEAEKHKGAKLSEAEKSLLLEPPLSDAEKAALSQIATKQALTPGAPLKPNEKLAALTNVQRIAIAPAEDQAALRVLREQAVLRLKALNTQFDKLVTDLIKVDETAGVNALTSYLQAENLKIALGCPAASCGEESPAGSYWMQLRVVSAGGNNKIKRNLITNLFTGDNISHSGGSIVEYILYDLNGRARHSNTFTVYEDYKKAKDIKRLADRND